MAGPGADRTAAATWLAKQLTIVPTRVKQLLHVQPVLQTSDATFPRAGWANAAAGSRGANAFALAFLPVGTLFIRETSVAAERPSQRTGGLATGLTQGLTAALTLVRIVGGKVADTGLSAGRPSRRTGPPDIL